MNPSRQEIIKFAANGNQLAGLFLVAWVDYCHLLDDLWDDDNDLDQAKVVKVMLAFYANVSSNEFYQQHRHRFESLIEQAHIAWLDSDVWAERSDPRDIRAADVLKGYYHEVVFHTARLVGGLDHAIETTRRFRGYDYEDN